MPKDTLAIQAEQRILILRDQKVMLDLHLAELGGVETRALKQDLPRRSTAKPGVRRNPDRFPDDFMFELPADEVSHLRSQTVIPSSHGGSRYGNLDFTEQGDAMLSSVLRSTRAVEVNIAPIKTCPDIAPRRRNLSRRSLQSEDGHMPNVCYLGLTPAHTTGVS